MHNLGILYLCPYQTRDWDWDWIGI